MRAREIVSSDAVDALYQGADYGGLVRLSGAVGPQVIKCMRNEAQELTGKQLLRRSSGGYGGRSDVFKYLTAQDASEKGSTALSYGIELLSAVCQEVNEHRRGTELDLKNTPAQLACYPGDGGAFWAHHDGAPFDELDVSMSEESRRLISNRRVTAILYLQDGWEDSWGGALRAHCDSLGGQLSTDIQPEGGTLVLFRSRDLWHEVLPTFSPRFALTMWFHA